MPEKTDKPQHRQRHPPPPVLVVAQQAMVKSRPLPQLAPPMTERIIAILFPIFLLVAIGYAYARRTPTDMSVANRLNMDVFVPAVVFYAMTGKPVHLAEYAALALGAFGVMLGSGLCAWLVCHWRGIAGKTLIPPVVFNNSGNIGLPLAVLAWGEAALPAAIVLFMVENTLHFSFGARYLNPQTRLRLLWRVPVLFAALLGWLCLWLEVALWPPLLVGIRMLGEVSIPLMLFSLGVRLAGASFADWRIGLLGAVLRPVSGILAAWGLITLLELPRQQAEMLLVFGALPPAVLNFLFAERYRQEPQRVASIVLLGNLLAVVFLPLALWLGMRG